MAVDASVSCHDSRNQSLMHIRIPPAEVTAMITASEATYCTIRMLPGPSGICTGLKVDLELFIGFEHGEVNHVDWLTKHSPGLPLCCHGALRPRLMKAGPGWLPLQVNVLRYVENQLRTREVLHIAQAY